MCGWEKEERGRERANERKRQGFGRVTELQKAACKSQAKNGERFALKEKSFNRSCKLAFLVIR